MPARYRPVLDFGRTHGNKSIIPEFQRISIASALCHGTLHGGLISDAIAIGHGNCNLRFRCTRINDRAPDIFGSSRTQHIDALRNIITRTQSGGLHRHPAESGQGIRTRELQRQLCIFVHKSIGAGEVYFSTRNGNLGRAEIVAFQKIGRLLLVRLDAIVTDRERSAVNNGGQKAKTVAGGSPGIVRSKGVSGGSKQGGVTATGDVDLVAGPECAKVVVAG